MKKGLLLGAAFMLMVMTAQPAAAFLEVPSYGATGWQTFSWMPDGGFTGDIGWLVSDWGDDEQPSYLLVDNVIFGETSYGFETDPPSPLGYNFEGEASPVSSSAYGSGTFTPTEGVIMIELDSSDENTEFPTAPYGYGGTDGSVFWLTNVSVADGQTLTFDWNFCTTDYVPYQDFSLFLTDTGENLETYELGTIQTSAVPVPAAVWLLGSGLLGLLGLRKKISA